VVDVLGTAKVFVSIFDTRVDFGKIFPRHIGEFVVADFGGVTFGVVVLDEGIVGRPGGVDGVNLSIGVLFVEEFHPRLETSAGFDFVVCAVKGGKDMGKRRGGMGDEVARTTKEKGG
jgi:hypothetical protein